MTTSRFSPIDLSALPAPDVVTALDAEAIIVARKADIVARLAEVDQELADEVEAILTLESEPMTKMQESGAYREVIHYARVNEAARAVLVATAAGNDLESLGAFYGVSRMDGETDARLRERIILAPEALTTCGSAGAYIFQAMGVDVSIRSVGLYRDGEATVNVSIMVDDTDDGAPSEDLLNAVRARLNDDAIKPLTDDVVVLGPVILTFDVDIRLTLSPGPDGAAVRAASEASVNGYLATRQRTGVPVYLSGLDAAAMVAGVETIARIAPSSDIVPAPLEAGFAETVSVTIAA